MNERMDERMNEYNELVRLLRERGADFDETFEDGRDYVWWGDGEREFSANYVRGSLTVSGLSARMVVSATLGRGTCHMQTLSLDGLWLCDKCGYVNAGFALSPGLSTSPSYCPQCGARVVSG